MAPILALFVLAVAFMVVCTFGIVIYSLISGKSAGAYRRFGSGDPGFDGLYHQNQQLQLQNQQLQLHNQQLQLHNQQLLSAGGAPLIYSADPYLGQPSPIVDIGAIAGAALAAEVFSDMVSSVDPGQFQNSGFDQQNVDTGNSFGGGSGFDSGGGSDGGGGFDGGSSGDSGGF